MKKINTNGQRWSYNLKLKKYSLLVCIFFVISLSSCSDNPVDPGNTTPKIVDSSRYFESSSIVSINHYDRANIHVVDTSEFFLYTEFPPSIGFFKNRVEQYYPINGYNVIFATNFNSKILFGMTAFGRRSVGLFEWNGNGVNELIIFNASNEDTLSLVNASIEHEGNLYMIDYRGKVLVYDGQNITKEDLPDLPDLTRLPPNYPIDQAHFIVDDWDNRVTLGFFFQEGNIIGNIKRHVLMYKLFDDGWKKVHSDEVVLTSNIEALTFYEVNKKLIKVKVQDVYLYSQGKFVLINSGYKNWYWHLLPLSIGNSPNDFFNIIEVEPDPKRPWEAIRLVHWNGINYSIEFPEFAAVLSRTLVLTNYSEDLYIVALSGDFASSIHFLIKK